MKTPLIIATLIATFAPASAFATDDCPSVPRDQWLSVAAITAKAEKLGYKVRKVEVDDGCLEAYATDKAGKRVEIYFHPGTGNVVKVKADD